MKRTATFLMLLALAGSGCVHVPPAQEEVRQPPVEAEAPPPPPPVTAGQITAENAAEKARALEAELDRAAEEPPPVKAPDPVEHGPKR